MVGVKDMEMSRDCFSCFISYGDCPSCNAMHGCRPDDCPLREIVTCKDCIHYDKELKECMVNNIQCYDDFYCKDGERRE